MTLKDKIILIFLVTITFGLYYFLVIKKNKSEENVLSVDTNVKVNINKLVELIGLDNIDRVDNSHTKVTIYIKDRSNIDIESIRSLSGISGIFATSSYITILVGKSAQLVRERIERLK